MTLNYYIQHKLFKHMILKTLPVEDIKNAINNDDSEFFTGLLNTTLDYFGDQAPEERKGSKYETTFVTIGDLKLARCKFTGDLPARSTECSSILIAATDKAYYFTIEHFLLGGYMICRWNDDAHLNYGSVDNDEPELYLEKIKNAITNN